MTRVFSAVVLLVVVLSAVLLLPAAGTTALVAIVAVLSVIEYRALAGALGVEVPAVLTTVGAVAVCVAMGTPGTRIDGILLAATLAIGLAVMGSSRSGADVLRDASGSLFAVLYIGLPLGALAAIRAEREPTALLLLLCTVVASDTVQFYGGRLFGRKPLAPTISPKKTIEGALCGFVGGTLVMVGAGRWWMSDVPWPVGVLLGIAVVALGIGGDLFESALKRGAGVKDASALIPGHGGMLDRIDGLLFAGPVFYVFLRGWS